MQLADAVPLGRVLAEIVLRGLRPLRPHRGEALAIARERHVLGIQVGNELAGKLGGIPTIAQAEERP